MSTLLKKYGGVGLTAWTVNGDGKLCSLGAAGERIKGSEQPYITTGDSRHKIGSLNKGMTAVLFATLIEDGTIPKEEGWDATLGSLLPYAKGTLYESVTIKQLLGMLSGLQRTPNVDWSSYVEQAPNDVRKQRELVAHDALNSNYTYPPGTVPHYSNWGYVLAGTYGKHLKDKRHARQWYVLAVLNSLLYSPSICYTSIPTPRRAYFRGACRPDLGRGNQDPYLSAARHKAGRCVLFYGKSLQRC